MSVQADQLRMLRAVQVGDALAPGNTDGRTDSTDRRLASRRKTFRLSSNRC